MSMNKKKTNSRNETYYWGEISEETRPLISDEVLRSLIKRAVKQEEPKKLPATDDEDEESVLPEYLTRPSEYVIHTIKLNEHAKAVQSLLDDVVPGKTVFQPCPPLPDLEIFPRQKAESNSGAVLTFELGQGPELPVLSNETINRILQKAVMVTLAETGFDKAKQSAVCVLIDIVREILTNICKMLHFFSQPDLVRERTLYRDPVEKVMQLMGLSGITELNEFYLKNVIGKRDNAIKRSKNLMNQYNSTIIKLTTPTNIEQDGAGIPEASFSSMNLNDPGVQNVAEPGFKALIQESDMTAVQQVAKISNASNKSVIQTALPPNTQEFILNGSGSIIKKRISGAIQTKRKKMKTD